MLSFSCESVANQARIRVEATTDARVAETESFRSYVSWLVLGQCAFLLLLLCILPTAAKAQQQITSSIAGTVQDPEKYSIGNAAVTIVNQDTGVEHKGKTGQEGQFLFPNLDIGKYTLTVSVEGFDTFKQSGIVLTSAEAVTIPNVILKLGSTSVTISVDSKADALDTTSPNLTTTLDSETIQEVSTRSGDVMELLALLPGAIDTQAGQHDTPDRNTVGGYEINGQNVSDGHVNINIDGVSNLAAGNPGYLSAVPSPDMVKEIKITASNYTSDTGGQGGPTLSIITRGGQKQFHGSFDFPYRSQALNANNPDNKKVFPLLPRAPYELLLPGGSISGPIIIPHLVPRRANLFFFAALQYQHQVTDNTSPTQVTVPTVAERTGDFSNSVDSVGNQINLINVCTIATNVICPSSINPMLQAVTDLLPLPNTISTTVCTGGISPCGYNYSWDPSDDHNRTTISGAIDWDPNNRPYSFSLRYLFGHDITTAATGSQISANSVPLGLFASVTKSHAVSFSVRNTISPTIVNSLVFGFNLSYSHAGALTPNYLTIAGTGINLPELYPNAPNFGLLPNFTWGGNIAGGASLGQDYRNPANGQQANINFTDNLSKVFARHVATAGVSMAIQQVDGNQQVNTRGAYDFSQNGGNVYDTNDTFANGLVGVLNSYTQTPIRVQSYLRTYDLEYFVQDVWKARSNLTLTIGNRFYQHPEPYEKENKLYGFAPSLYSQAAAPRLYTPISVTQVADPLNPSNVLGASFTGFYVPGRSVCRVPSRPPGRGCFPRAWDSLTALLPTTGPSSGAVADSITTGRVTTR
jgi:hypothetical protein